MKEYYYQRYMSQLRDKILELDQKSNLASSKSSYTQSNVCNFITKHLSLLLIV